MAGSLSAQVSSVVPAEYATVDANGLDVEPFGMDQLRHVHYIGASLMAGIPTNVALQRVAYRRDATLPGTLQRGSGATKVMPLWQVRMANFAGDPNTVTGLYPPVADPLWSIVFAPKQVDFPDLPAPPASGVPAFDVQLPFDIPFQRTSVGLGIEHYVYESRNITYNYFVDSVEAVPSSGTVDLISNTSRGCPADQNRAFGHAPNPGGGTLDLFLFGAEPSVPGFVNLGISETSWNSASLPFSLATVGLPGCNVYTDLVILLPVMTTLAGTAESHIPAPADPNLLGARFFAQFIMRDSRVNPAVNLAVSDGLRVTMGSRLGQGSPPMTIVSGYQNLAQGRSGIVQRGRGPVVQFQY